MCPLENKQASSRVSQSAFRSGEDAECDTSKCFDYYDNEAGLEQKCCESRHGGLMRAYSCS